MSTNTNVTINGKTVVRTSTNDRDTNVNINVNTSSTTVNHSPIKAFALLAFSTVAAATLIGPFAYGTASVAFQNPSQRNVPAAFDAAYESRGLMKVPAMAYALGCATGSLAP